MTASASSGAPAPKTDHPLAGSRWGIVILATLVIFGPLSIDLYLPAMPDMASEFGASAGQVQWTLTAFLAGFCVGMVIYGPVSDAVGRRPVVLFGTVVFVVASVACILVPDIEWLIALRFIQALGGGAASVMGRTIVRDIYRPGEAARALSLVALVTAVTPMLAPLAGGQILRFADWQAVFAALALYGLFALLLSWRTVPESLPVDNRRRRSVAGVLGVYRAIFTDTRALGCILGAGGSFAAMFAYIAGTPFVYIDYFGVSPQLYGVLFGVNILSQMTGTYLNSRLVNTLGLVRICRGAAAVTAMGGLALLVTGETGAGGLLGIALPLLLIIGMTIVLSANLTIRVMGLYPENAGAAAAALTAVSFGLGALSSLGVSLLEDGTPGAMALVIFVCCAISGLGLSPLFTGREE